MAGGGNQVKTLVDLSDEDRIAILRRLLGDAMILLHQAAYEVDEMRVSWHTNHQNLVREYRNL
jgi:hypothetical protein